MDKIDKILPQALGKLDDEIRELSYALNHDRDMILRLIREPVIARTPYGPVRRYRLSTKGGWLRLLFIVDVKSCTIIFTDADIRDEETYMRFRRRLRGT